MSFNRSRLTFTVTYNWHSVNMRWCCSWKRKFNHFIIWRFDKFLDFTIEKDFNIVFMFFIQCRHLCHLGFLKLVVLYIFKLCHGCCCGTRTCHWAVGLPQFLKTIRSTLITWTGYGIDFRHHSAIKTWLSRLSCPGLYCTKDFPINKCGMKKNADFFNIW